jgi:hypothetical protein
VEAAGHPYVVLTTVLGARDGGPEVGRDAGLVGVTADAAVPFGCVGDDEATGRWVSFFMLLGERPWGASTTSGRDGVAVGGAPTATGVWIRRLATCHPLRRRGCGYCGLLSLRPGSSARRDGAGWRPPSRLGAMNLAILLARHGCGMVEAAGAVALDLVLAALAGGGGVRASRRGASWDPMTSSLSASAGWGLFVVPVRAVDG